MCWLKTIPAFGSVPKGQDLFLDQLMIVDMRELNQIMGLA
jgi:hypothetical protein